MTGRDKDVLREMRPVIRPWLEHGIDTLPQGDQLPDRVRARVFEEVRSTGSRGSLPNTRLAATFGVPRFAVAAVVVMLVAGVLLSGVLRQGGDSPVPGAASPTSSAEPTAPPEASPSAVAALHTITVDSEGGGDFTTIAEALVAAVDGDEIVVAPGYYPESPVISKDVAVRGDGDPGGVVIEYGDWSPTFADSDTYDPSQPFGVHLSDSDGSVANLTLSGPRVGLSIVITGGSPTLDGLTLDAGPKSATVSDDGRESIRVYGDGHPTIRNSTWDGSYWEAPGAAATLEDNVVTDACLYMEGGRDSSVLDNQVGECITFVGGTGGRIEGNVLEQGFITLDGAGDVIVRGNTLRGATDPDGGGAITIGRIGSGSEISGNTVSEAAVAIAISSVIEVPLTGNILESNGVGVLNMFATWPPLVDNVFCGNGADLAFGPAIAASGAELPSLGGNEVCADGES